MALFKAGIPESKRFFKISELAGERWPNVSENEIYDWHDKNITMPTESSGGMEITNSGEINFISFWVFFSEFRSLRSTEENNLAKDPSSSSGRSANHQQAGGHPAPKKKQHYLNKSQKNRFSLLTLTRIAYIL